MNLVLTDLPESEEMDDLGDEYVSRRILEALGIEYWQRHPRSNVVCLERFRSYQFWKKDGRWHVRRALISDGEPASADSLRELIKMLYTDPHCVDGEDYIHK